MLSWILVFVCLLVTSHSTCTSLAGICFGVTQNTLQFNINWRGIPTYEDAVSSFFNENQCGRKRYSILYHKVLKCKKTDIKRKYDCVSTTKSVWIKVFDTTDYMMQQYLSKCNNKMAEKYIDISKLSCLIDGVDPFATERNQIKEVQTRTIEVDENNYPVYHEYYPGEGSCVWNYEVNGLQISFYVILSIVFVVLVLFIAIFVYAQKYRKEKRNSLNHTMKERLVDSSVSSV